MIPRRKVGRPEEVASVALLLASDDSSYVNARGAAKTSLASLARRWMDLDAEIAELDTLLGHITLQTAPSLLALPGVGPDVAGDRTANCALFRIVLCRLIRNDETRGYMARRIAEGETQKGVIRCLKRHVARQVYRVILQDLEISPAPPPNHLEQVA